MTRVPPCVKFAAGVSSPGCGAPGASPSGVEIKNAELRNAAARLKLIAFDCDGVLWVGGGGALPGAADITGWIKSIGVHAIALTNNAALSRESYEKKAAEMGIPLETADFYCTSYLIGKIAAEKYAGKKALVLGSGELLAAAANAGADAVHAEKDVAALKSADFRTLKYDAVIVGLDVGLSYAELCHAVTALENGADFIATNPDYTFPMQDGYLWPGNGAFVELIERVSGRRAEVIGKPSPRLLELAMRELGATPAETLVVGDRLSTDVMCGKNAGAFTCLVMTGVAGGGSEACTGDIVPDMTARDLTMLHKWLKEVLSEGAGSSGAKLDG